MTKGMVKCLICGAVLEEGLPQCPVCGIGPEKFVPAEPEERAFCKDTDERFVVLGTGAAALSAATAIRERNRTCSIVMISNERALPYHRPMLTKHLLQKNGREAFAVHGASWYQERGIRLVTDEIVSLLDPRHRVVGLSDDTVLPYDQCIYALGARCFVPPMPGTHLPEAVTIRTLDDVERISRLAPVVTDAVVIGGGVLGLEAACEIQRAGMRVTVLESADRLLPRQLGQTASRLLVEIAAEQGLRIRLGAKTAYIMGIDHVTGVRLEDGEELAAQMVLLATGMRPNAKIAANAGIAVGRAVIVDAHMRTNAANVYACGDCAEFDGVNYGIWPEAVEMGRVAGANAAGETWTYCNRAPSLSLNTLGTSLFAFGDTGRRDDAPYEIVSELDEREKTLKTDYYLDGRRVGGVRIGEHNDIEALIRDVSGQA